MLSHISWQQYLTAAGILIAAYYLLATLVFYKKELIRLLTGKRLTAPLNSFSATIPANVMGAVQEDPEILPEIAEQETSEPEILSNRSLEFYPDDNPEDAYPDEAAISDTFDELEQLSMHLRLLMEESGRKVNRTELTAKIQKELTLFSAKTDPENFKEAINRFVRQQCKELCNVQIEPADLKFIWSKTA
jgi:hypothetical protein